jgi:hypothetical protein
MASGWHPAIQNKMIPRGISRPCGLGCQPFAPRGRFSKGTSKKMSVTKKKRFEILSRDGFACVYCGQKGDSVKLEIDHVIPKSKGGSNEIGNLVTACFECNRGKSTRLLSEATTVDIVVRNNERVVSMAESETAKIRAVRAAKRELSKFIRELEAYFSDCILQRESKTVRFFLSELGPSVVMDSAEIASCRRSASVARWKYFCGICWNKIRSKESEVS